MKAFCKILILAICCLPTLILGQNKYVFSGLLKDQKGTPIENAPVQLLEVSQITISDQEGRFSFEPVDAGTYTLVIQTINYEFYDQKIQIGKVGEKGKTFVLTENVQQLQEVQIEGKQSSFGITQLKAVQDGGLYEAKKNEVINIDQLVGNKAANNARQAYAKVPSLNVWESDNAGIQLDIGGRGLSPRRSSNFNVRQNGYDISADALGYPESYYSPALQAVEKIEIVRGAGALQYGTQFGGLVNFKLKSGSRDKPIEVNTQNTYGAFNFFSTFNSVGGQLGKVNYYAYYNFKRGDGWRENTAFDSHSGFAGLEYQINPKLKLKIEYTILDYLSQQPGGLNSIQFKENPRASNRDRGFFKVNWNLISFLAEYEINENAKIYSRTFGLDARRISLGLLETPNEPDLDTNRDLIDGSFLNIGNETRGVFKYNGLSTSKNELLIGMRLYRGNTNFIQGIGTDGSDPVFTQVDTVIERRIVSDFDFPNFNAALFGESIFRLSESFSLVPGFRYELIDTQSSGVFSNPRRINSFGTEFNVEVVESNERSRRHVFLWGLGISKKFQRKFELYANVTANYRAINFTDVQIQANAQVVDPNIRDERGQSFDLGLRNLENGSPFRFELTAFLIRYNDRIGEVSARLNANREIVERGGVLGRLRTNIGNAVIGGFEVFGELDVADILGLNKQHKASIYYNGALSIGRYKDINERVTNAVSTGNRVEDLPTHNIKGGVTYGYKNFSSSLQATYVTEQFSDAANEDPLLNNQSSIDLQRQTLTGVVGTIPTYFVLDFSVDYRINKLLKIHATVNNLLDRAYFTRRATGYPGPGIIPALGRTWNFTLDVTF